MDVGFASAVMTPPAGTYLAGFSARTAPARGVHDDLYARAMAFNDGARRAVVVACDLCAIDAGFVAEVRDRITERTGLSAEAVLIAAIHTHAAPATMALYSPPPDAVWRTRLPDAVADTAEAALNDLGPATLRLGIGREDTVGRNRRRADGPNDPTVTVLRADRAGRPPALLLHYACHPTVLGPDNLLISRDYVGFALDHLEGETGGTALFVNGACGDINAGHSADRSALGLPIEGRTFERAGDLGRRLGREAAHAAANGTPLGGAVRAATRWMRVPLRPAPSVAVMREQCAAWRDRVRALEAQAAGDDVLGAARLELFYAELGMAWVTERGQRVDEPVEVQAIGLGDLGIVALPGEFFAESGLRLRQRSPFPHTLAIGYANGGIGYVPPVAAFAEGGYETRLAPWSRVAAEAEGMILETGVALLDSLRDGLREEA
jgi:hypothetical protein